MKLSEIRDFGDWFNKQGKEEPKAPPPSKKYEGRKSDDIINTAYKRLRALGQRAIQHNTGSKALNQKIANIDYSAVHSWLMGGGAPVGLDAIIDFLENEFNFDSGWTQYEENEQTWQHLGISKDELHYLADLSNGEVEED